VDSVNPKADEDLLELMVRIAENPSEWQQVHHLLRKYMTSSKKTNVEKKMWYNTLILNVACALLICALHIGKSGYA
jgi:hypothetical protein